MVFSVFVEQADGQFTASLVGDRSVYVVGSTREEALAAIRRELRHRIHNGELVLLDVSTGGLMSLAGKYADDPSLQEICKEAYAERERDIAE